LTTLIQSSPSTSPTSCEAALATKAPISWSLLDPQPSPAHAEDSPDPSND
jgi:hypothetical protein